MKLTNLALTLALALAPVAMLAEAPGQLVGQNVPNRQYEQQQRINQGERSGQLTGNEARNLEHGQRSISRQESRMRARHGGRLTRHDRRKLNRRQNRQSRRIQQDKHNGYVR